MPQIILDKATVVYPAKAHRRPSLKDLLIHGILGRTPPRRDVMGLDQVTLRVTGGECVGIIGRNGAGKSTLLRAVAGVYPLTNGLCRVEGSVCSLFDIAAGFEWNATGWENIRLRAYLQGETPATLADKIDAIADFAELGSMLDMPLKSYSTGRIMLLSFAIAAGCAPDVLLIDEFLSTSDVLVREKIVRQLIAMLRQGRTVLIASHDLAFLRPFCTRMLWLEKGGLRDDGPVEQVIEDYLGAAAAMKTAEHTSLVV